MNTGFINAVYEQLVEWHFGPSKDGPKRLSVVLNDKVKVYIFILDSDQSKLRVALRPVRNYEVIWMMSLADPTSFEQLRDFLHQLPGELAQIEPETYAV